MPVAIHSPLELGQAARSARRRLGLTQPQLALAAGVGVRFVVDLEAGKPTMRLATLMRVLSALGGELAVSGWEPADPSASAPAAPAATVP